MPETEPASRVAPGPVLPPAPLLRGLGVACGLDLEAFRPTHVARTIDRAVERLGLDGPGALRVALGRDPLVRARFRRAVAVSTSGMWRDPQQFELLGRLLREAGDAGSAPRVWSVGASDGSELCSVALLLQRAGALEGADLLGSDLLPENVQLARERSAERLDPGARRAVRFEERDVIGTAPAGTFDVVLCRNVLIHLAGPARRRMLGHAIGALAPGGILLLGRSERLLRDERGALDDAGPSAYRRDP